MRMWLMPVAICAALFVVACGDDDDEGTEADRLGVGAECAENAECEDTAPVCLTAFSGGYCGIDNCESHDDCPAAAACVAHDDGMNYCFRVCDTKAECNENRTADNESNCSANITFVGEDRGKACVPPSGS